MKIYAFPVILACTFLATLSTAQRNVAAAPGGRARFAAGVRPDSGFGHVRSQPRFPGIHGRFGLTGYYPPLPWAYPAFEETFGQTPGCGEATTAAPIVVAAPAPEPPAPPPPPPDPARPVLREYTWPSATGDEGAATFALVLADSTVRFAGAVWVQDGDLHYIAPDGSPGLVRGDAINREATRNLNAERGLRLVLPQPPVAP